ncbi:MAG: hypothetical protein AB1Z63_12310 [Candidatus Limnocylindrales bacterium]
MVKDRSARAALLFSVLLAVGGTAAQAQDGSAVDEDGAAAAQQAAPVSGTSTLVGQVSPGTRELDGAIIRVRGNELLTVEAASDPRVSGEALITVNFDAYPGPDGLPGATQVRFGQMRLENADGAWSGSFTGSLGGAGFIQTYWLEGEGAYEGLSYVVTAGGNGNVWQSSGLIFPGDLPPMGGSVSLPVDPLERDMPTAWSPPT